MVSFLEVLEVFNAILAEAYIVPNPDPHLHFKLNLRGKMAVTKSAQVKP